MPKSRSNHVVLNANKSCTTKDVLDATRCRLQFSVCMECQHCGEVFPMPMGLVQWVTAVSKAFAAAHKNCQKAS